MPEILKGLTARELDILNDIRQNGPVTKSSLMAAKHLTLSTLSRAMRRLEDRGLVCESGVSGSTGGRRPVEYDAAPEGGFSVGVDISRTYVRVVLLDMKVRVRGKEQLGMGPDMTPQACVGRVAGIVARMAAGLPAGGGLWGLGVGTVGPVDRAAGRLLYPRGFPGPGWEREIPLAEWFRAQTGLPCEIDNGANAAVLAEYRFGAGRGCRNLAYVHCGVGIRSAVIRGGAVVRSLNNREDALGHMTVDIHGAPCRCGGRGCLEGYASLAAVRAFYRRTSGQDAGYAALFDLASAGDRAAREAFRRSGAVLGVGLSNLVRLLSPERIILSGPSVSRVPAYFDACVEAFRRQNRARPGPDFRREGDFREDAVAVGAGLLPFETHLIPKRGEAQGC